MTRRSSSPNGDRGDQVEVAEAVLARAWGWPPASGPWPGPGRAPGRRRPAASDRRPRAAVRSTGTSVVLDEQRQRGRPPPVVLERVIDDERVAREDVGAAPGGSRAASASSAALPIHDASERPGGQRRDQQDQVDLLVQARDQRARATRRSSTSPRGSSDGPLGRTSGCASPRASRPTRPARLRRRGLLVNAHRVSTPSVGIDARAGPTAGRRLSSGRGRGRRCRG